MGRKATVTLEDVMESTGITARAEARGEARGRAEAEAKALETMRFFIEQGVPLDTVASGFKLPPEKVRELTGGARQ